MHRYNQMTDADHVKAFRLFELQRAESVGKHFQLEAWEHQHLQECAECRSVVEVFARQFDGQNVPLPERSGTSSTIRRFKTGDHVKIIGPGKHYERSGIVTNVIEPKAGDFVYRYSVDLAEAGTKIFLDSSWTKAPKV